MLVRIGYGNVVAEDRVVIVLEPSKAPVQRLIRHAKEERMVLDVTGGRRTKAVAVMDNGGVLLLGLTPRELGKRGLPIEPPQKKRRRRKRAR